MKAGYTPCPACCSCPSPMLLAETRSAMASKCGVVDPSGDPTQVWKTHVYYYGGHKLTDTWVFAAGVCGVTTADAGPCTDPSYAPYVGQTEFTDESGNKFFTRTDTYTANIDDSGILSDPGPCNGQTWRYSAHGVLTVVWSTTCGGEISEGLPFLQTITGGIHVTTDTPTEHLGSCIIDHKEYDITTDSTLPSGTVRTTVFSDPVPEVHEEFSDEDTINAVSVRCSAELAAAEYHSTYWALARLSIGATTVDKQEGRYKFRFSLPRGTQYILKWIERFQPTNSSGVPTGVPTDTIKSFTWDGSASGYDPSDETTWPTTPEYAIGVPATNGYTTLICVNVTCAGEPPADECVAPLCHGTPCP